MPPTTPSTGTRQQDWYAELEGFPGTWATTGAPSQRGTSTKVADGGAPEETLPGDPTWDQMTLGRNARRGRAMADCAKAKADYGMAKTATVYCKGPDGVIAESFTVVGRIAGHTGPSGDRSSTTNADVSITLDVDDVLYDG